MLVVFPQYKEVNISREVITKFPSSRIATSRRWCYEKWPTYVSMISMWCCTWTQFSIGIFLNCFYRNLLCITRFIMSISEYGIPVVLIFILLLNFLVSFLSDLKKGTHFIVLPIPRYLCASKPCYWCRPDYFVDILLTKTFLSKIFEGEMCIRILPTTLLQIFCENSLYFQFIFKNMKIADDTFLGNSECEWVKRLSRLPVKPPTHLLVH